MSSEMMEYVAALRDREHRFHGMGGHYVAEVIRGELEAILARTEAGADGVDVREALDDRLDWLKKVSGPAKAFQASNVVVRLTTAEESLRMLFAATLRTHPQDASGDVEPRFQPLDRVVWTSKLGTEFRGAIRHINEPQPLSYWIDLDDGTSVQRAIESDIAMQAKEAK